MGVREPGESRAQSSDCHALCSLVLALERPGSPRGRKEVPATPGRVQEPTTRREGAGDRGCVGSAGHSIN